MYQRAIFYVIPVIVLAGILGWGIYQWVDRDSVEYIEKTEYSPPRPPAEEFLMDDRLENKNPAFEPGLVDRRPLGEWQINQSAAVIKLDVTAIKPDQEADLLQLHPSYKAAIADSIRARTEILPSVNMLDGKAKQFDDGLYAALDQAYYRGLKDHLQSHVQLVRRIYEKVDKNNPAASFLAAGLELAGVHAEPGDRSAKEKWLKDFRDNEVASKPIGFYTWSETLADCFRFLRFFQKEFELNQLEIPLGVGQAVRQDPALLADYKKAMDFYGQLTSPNICLSVADLISVNVPTADALTKIAIERGIWRRRVAFFPASTSRETVLFERLFPLGLPPDANLMKELIGRIRSGDVDLKPGPKSGWYDYQACALETLLLPEKGSENQKLLLTKAYKKRMLEAFQVLVTKRRETHVRQLGIAETASVERMPEEIRPRLRVEPCPSYYLRTARAYAFLTHFLEAAIGKEALQSLHGLRQEGERHRTLYNELQGMRDLFYGLYLVSADDIGLKTAFAAGEPVDVEVCYRAAQNWLANVVEDPDLAVDTRVSVPLFQDPGRRIVRLWATLGVRLAKLEATYASAPQIKPVKEGAWQLVESFRLGPSHYLIAVEEFAEVELGALKTLTREELRAICDREKTKDAIVEALQKIR